MIIKNPSNPLKLTLVNFTANTQPAKGTQINCKVVVVIHKMWWKRRKEKTEISVKEIKKWIEIGNKLSELEEKCDMVYEIIDTLGDDLQSTEPETRKPEIIRILNRSSENITMKSSEEQENEITDKEIKWKRFNDQLKSKMNDVSNKIETGIYNEETQWYTFNKELRMCISNVTVMKGPTDGRQEFCHKTACIGTHASTYNCRCNNTYIGDLLKSTVDKMPRCKPLFGLKTKLPSKIKPILKSQPQNHKKTQTNITISNISNLQSSKAASVHSLDSNYAIVLPFPSIEAIAAENETISVNSSYSEFSTIISLNSYDSIDSKHSIKAASDSVFIPPSISEIKSIKKKAAEDASPSFKSLTTPIAIKIGDRICVCSDYVVARKAAATSVLASRTPSVRSMKTSDQAATVSPTRILIQKKDKTTMNYSSPGTSKKTITSTISTEIGNQTCVCSDYGVARKAAASFVLASASARSMKTSDKATTVSPTEISIKKKDKTIMDYSSPGTSKKTITSNGATSTESHTGTQTEKDSFSTSLKPSVILGQGIQSLGSSKSLTNIDQANQKSSESLKSKTTSTSSGAGSSSTKLKSIMETVPPSSTQLTTQNSSVRLEDETTSTNSEAGSSSSTKLKSMMTTVPPSSTQLITQKSFVRLEDETTSTNSEEGGSNSTKLKGIMKTVTPSSTQLITQKSSVPLQNETTSTNSEEGGSSSTKLKSIMKTVTPSSTQLTTKSSVRLENETASTNFGAGSSSTKLKSMMKMVPSSSAQLSTKSSVRLETETTSASSGSIQSRKSRTSSESISESIQSTLWIKSTGSILMRKSGKSPSGSSESVKSTERTRLKSQKSNESSLASVVSIETIKSAKSLTEAQRNKSYINLKEATINESRSKQTNCCPLFKFFKKGNDKPKNDRQKNVKNIQDSTQNAAISDEESNEHFRLEVKESTDDEYYAPPSMESRYQVFPVVTTYKSDTKCVDTRYSKTTNIEINELLPLLVMLPEFKRLDDQVYELMITLYPVKHAGNYCDTELCPRTLPVTVNTRFNDYFPQCLVEPIISRGPQLQRSECQIYTQMQSQTLLQTNKKGQMAQIDDGLFLFNLNIGAIKNLNKIEEHTVTQTEKESFSTSLKPSISIYQDIQSLESKFGTNSKSLTNIGQATQKSSVSLKYRTTPISSGAGSSSAKLKSMNSIKTVPPSKSPEKRTSVQIIQPCKFSTSSKSIQSLLWIKSTGSIRMRKPSKSPTVSSGESTERTRSKEKDIVFVESQKPSESLAANLVSVKIIISAKSPTETSGDTQRVKRNKSQKSSNSQKSEKVKVGTVKKNSSKPSTTYSIDQPLSVI